MQASGGLAQVNRSLKAARAATPYLWPLTMPMHLAVSLTCLLVAIIGNTWELTYNPPRWPVLVIGVWHCFGWQWFC
jgi:hypothetical protein